MNRFMLWIKNVLCYVGYKYIYIENRFFIKVKGILV